MHGVGVSPVCRASATPHTGDAPAPHRSLATRVFHLTLAGASCWYDKAMPTFKKIACFGGVYNNYLALEAAISDAKERRAEALFCLGDLGRLRAAPRPCVSAHARPQRAVHSGKLRRFYWQRTRRLPMRLHRSARQPLRPNQLRLHARQYIARQSRIFKSAAQRTSHQPWAAAGAALSWQSAESE